MKKYIVILNKEKYTILADTWEIEKPLGNLLFKKDGEKVAVFNFWHCFYVDGFGSYES